MKPNTRTRLLFAALLASIPLRLGTPVCQAGGLEPLTTAVFDFESRDDVGKEAGPQASSLINALLSAEPALITVERAELSKLLDEQELGLAGTISTETAAKVGQLTGAKVLVTGRVFKAGPETVLVAKIIGTETSRVYGEVVKAGGKPLTDLATELAGKIANTVRAKADTLVAKTRRPEDRVAAIRRALGAAPRPAVRVTIPERHFGGPTFDPAAETEFNKLLGECGFTGLDAKAEQKPRFELTGEACSECGMRKGNLVSCKARVEIKVRDTATGELRAVDRHMSVAVDVSEQLAAKTALQRAAGELAERVIPKLVQ